MMITINQRKFADGSQSITQRNDKGNQKKVIKYSQERNSKYKKWSNAREKLLSFEYTHFVTLTVPETSELRTNPQRLFKLGKKFLLSTDRTFVLILEIYKNGGYHLHALTDDEINLQDWCKLTNADFNNCYCKTIYTNRLSCANYLLKKIHLIPKNLHHCFTNSKNFKSKFTKIEDGETIYQNQQAAINTDDMKNNERVILDESTIELSSDDFNIQDPLASLNLTVIDNDSIEIHFRNYSFDELRNKRNNLTDKCPIKTSQNLQQNQIKNQKFHFSKTIIQYTIFFKYIIKCFLRKKLARAPPKIKN